MTRAATTLAYCLALAGATTLLGIPVAHADGSKGDHDAHAFWEDATSAGFTGSVESGEKLAETICSYREGGETKEQSIARGMQSIPRDVQDTGADRTMVMFTIFAAQFHYCPDLLGQP